MAELCEEVRAPFQAATVFGLADYPTIIADMESRGALRHRALGLVLYHCDVSTLYTEHGPLNVKAGKKRRRKKKAWERESCAGLQPVMPEGEKAGEERRVRKPVAAAGLQPVPEEEQENTRQAGGSRRNCSSKWMELVW